MKILFKNKTTYSKDLYVEYLSFHQKKFGFQYKLYTAIIIMLLIFCLTIQVINHNYSIAIIFCTSITAFFLYRYIKPLSMVTKEANSENIVNEIAFTFTFYDKYFKISTIKEYSHFKYSKLFKIFKSDKFFYLYIDKTHAFVLNSDCFSIGDSSNFANFLKQKCRFKCH